MCVESLYTSPVPYRCSSPILNHAKCPLILYVSTLPHFWLIKPSHNDTRPLMTRRHHRVLGRSAVSPQCCTTGGGQGLGEGQHDEVNVLCCVVLVVAGSVTEDTRYDANNDIIDEGHHTPWFTACEGCSEDDRWHG